MLRWFALAALVAAGCVSAADAQEYDSKKDFNTLNAVGNNHPQGIWSDGTIMWVVDDTDDKIYAYHLSNKSHYEDFALASANTDPIGIWSDDTTTIWVADYGDDKIFAYHLNGTHYSTKDFSLAAGNTDPSGIWSDGTTIWVADYGDKKIFAYYMNGTRYPDTNTDFNLIAANTDPSGIWSDGTTMWVVDTTNARIYSYKMSDKTLDTSKGFTKLIGAGNLNPNGIWSDGNTMWVTDAGATDKIYAYRMHSAPTTPTTPTTSSPRVFVYVPPPDTTPPTVKSVERTGNATTTDRALTWDVRFSESVRVGLKEIHTSYTSAANATIPDLGMVHDTLLAGVPGMATGGSISVDLKHPITSGLLIEIVAPDCTKFTIHNQTTTFPYKLRQPYDLGDLSGVGAAGQWTLHVSDHAKYWNGTLNGWTLYLESEGVVEGDGRTYTITQYAAGPGEYTLSLEGFDIRDRAGNRLVDTDPAVNEPYQVVGAARTCQAE